MNMPKMSSRFALFLLLLIISSLTIVPYLGLTNFHTKGEPREAIVAVSMLQNDNWILPVNNGSDIAYKPPLFPLVHCRTLPAHRRGDRVYLAAAVGSGLNRHVGHVLPRSLPSAVATTWPFWPRCYCSRASKYTGRPWPRG